MIFELVFIFFARIIDVSLGTIRTILIIRGDKYIAAIIGFFEIMVYVVALGKVIDSLGDPVRLVVFCGGFACGVIVGSWIEERIALGYRGLQATTSCENSFIVQEMREQGYAVTTWTAEGLEGPKLVISMWLKRNAAWEVAERIRQLDESAFIVFMEPKSFAGGYIKKK